MSSKIKVIELFAGVGGFRLGLEGWNGKSASSNYKKPLKSKYKVVWSNQWEPSTKRQHANEVYSNRWSDSTHFGDDINSVASPDFTDKAVNQKVPDHELLVGGFPCQDYSVAGVNTKGIQGKKGVLWWNIHKILKAKRPPYVLLENVDRLLKSPTSQRGRDFAILLSTMAELGYSVEWRVINAAEYGMPQRRRRVFIVGYHSSAPITISDLTAWRENDGILAKAFPADFSEFQEEQVVLTGKVSELSKSFTSGAFANSGVMVSGKVSMSKCTPVCEDPSEFSFYHTLKDVLVKDSNEIPSDFFISHGKKLKQPLVKKQKVGSELSYLQVSNECEVVLETELEKWKYLKGKKAEERVSAKGTFYYTEGPLKLFDDPNRASRTIITSEGGPGPSRFKHLIEVKDGVRRLTPIELERLNMFPDNHTEFEGINDSRRAFFMGNALVVGVVERIGKELSKRHFA